MYGAPRMHSVNPVGPFDTFTYIIQGCFTDTGATVWLPTHKNLR